jgi:hypothetical protein
MCAGPVKLARRPVFLIFHGGLRILRIYSVLIAALNKVVELGRRHDMDVYP